MVLVKNKSKRVNMKVKQAADSVLGYSKWQVDILYTYTSKRKKCRVIIIMDPNYGSNSSFFFL